MIENQVFKFQFVTRQTDNQRKSNQFKSCQIKNRSACLLPPLSIDANRNGNRTCYKKCKPDPLVHIRQNPSLSKKKCISEKRKEKARNVQGPPCAEVIVASIEGVRFIQCMVKRKIDQNWRYQPVHSRNTENKKTNACKPV